MIRQRGDHRLYQCNGKRDTLIKLAGFPAIKTIDDYEFKFALGAPKKLIHELTSLSLQNMCII